MRKTFECFARTLCVWGRALFYVKIFREIARRQGAKPAKNAVVKIVRDLYNE